MPRKITRSSKTIQQQRKLAESPHEMGNFRNALALLPAGEDALLSHAAMRLDQFNDAMLCGDVESIGTATLFYWAAVWRLNGETSFGCALDGGGLQKVQQHLAPPLGQPTRWGERGEWLLEVRGIRFWVRTGCSSLDGRHGVVLHAVDPQSPFLNEHGEHQLQVWPCEHRGWDFARALRQEVERLLTDECPPVALRDSARAAIKRPYWLDSALGGVTHNGQQPLQLSELDAPEVQSLVVLEPKVPKSNSERQRLFRQREKERKAQAKADGVLTLQLSERDRTYLASALDYYDFQNPLKGKFFKGNLLELYQRLQPDNRGSHAWPADEDRAAWYSRQVWHVICDTARRKQERAETELVAARAEIERLQALLGQIAAEFGVAMPPTNQQINKSTELTPSPAGEAEAFSLELMRRHKWKGGREEDVALVSVLVVPHEGQWMWAASLSSQNGAGYSYAPLPKWGRFAATPGAALQQGLAEVREFRARVTPAERKRLDDWLAGEVAERLAQMGLRHNEEIDKSTNQQMLFDSIK